MENIIKTREQLISMKTYVVNAFAKTPGGGNPAGVVLEADKISKGDMLSKAKELGLSETAFVSKSEKADYRIRYFTPVEEVDVCGHATIGTFLVMKKQGLIKDGKYTIETKAGVLNIELSKKGIYMQQKRPEYYEEIDKNKIADCLNINEEDFPDMPNMPIQIVSTGLKDILVPVKDLNTLLGMKPDFGRIAELSRKYQVIGMHVFTLETKFSSTAHTRNFAPLYEINEEAATGTSNGALACYLFKHGKAKQKEMSFEQGYSMGRPSEVKVRLITDNDEIEEVWVGEEKESQIN
jgi:PhzF family phenazine biosynthesis protein